MNVTSNHCKAYLTLYDDYIVYDTAWVLAIYSHNYSIKRLKQYAAETCMQLCNICYMVS